MSEPKEILEAALKLGPQERAHLAGEILASLDADTDGNVEGLWLEEVNRRSDEIDAGTAELVDWSDVRERIDRRLRGR